MTDLALERYFGTLEGVGTLIGGRVAEKEDERGLLLSTFETMPIGAIAVSSIFRHQSSQYVQPGFNPARDADLRGYEEYLDEFMRYARSPAGVRIVKAQIDHELEARKVLTDSGATEGFLASMVAGLASPENLVPFASAWRFLRAGKAAGALRVIGETAATGGASAAIAEGLTHPFQATRTLEESLANIGVSTVLSGLLFGGGAAAIRGTKRWKAAASLIDDPPEIGAYSGSVGAARSGAFFRVPALEGAEGKGEKALFEAFQKEIIENEQLPYRHLPWFKRVTSRARGGLGIVGTLFASPAPTARTIVRNFTNMAGRTLDDTNPVMNVSSQLEIANGGFTSAALSGLQTYTDNAAAMLEGMIAREFMQEAYRASSRLDPPSATVDGRPYTPEFAAVVKAEGERLQKELFQPLWKITQESGALTYPDHPGQAAYATRVVASSKVLGQEEDFREFFRQWYVDHHGLSPTAARDVIEHMLASVGDIPAGRGAVMHDLLSGVERLRTPTDEAVLDSSLAAQFRRRLIDVTDEFEAQMPDGRVVRLDNFLELDPISIVDSLTARTVPEAIIGRANRSLAMDFADTVKGKIDAAKKLEDFDEAFELIQDLRAARAAQLVPDLEGRQAIGRFLKDVEQRQSLRTAAAKAINLVQSKERALKRLQKKKAGDEKIQLASEALSKAQSEPSYVAFVRNRDAIQAFRVANKVGSTAKRPSRLKGKTDLANALAKAAKEAREGIESVRGQIHDDQISGATLRAVVQIEHARAREQVRTTETDIKKREKALRRIERQARKDAKAITYMFKAMRNLHGGVGLDPSHWALRTERFALNLGAVTKLGGGVLPAIADVGFSVLQHGFKSVIRAARVVASEVVFTKTGELKFSREELVPMLAALEFASSGRAIDMSMVQAARSSESILERAVAGAAGNGLRVKAFGRELTVPGIMQLNLQNTWNRKATAAVAIAAMDDLARAVALHSKKPAPSWLSIPDSAGADKQAGIRLKLAGLDPDSDAFQRIADQLFQHGEQYKGVILFRTQDWDDDLAQSLLRQIAAGDVRRTILKPPTSELPRSFTIPLVRAIAQFKRFPVDAFNKITVPLLDRMRMGDLRVAEGIVAGLAVGALISVIRDAIRGKDPYERTPNDFAFQAVDRSGLLGILMDANNIADRFSSGNFGPITRAFGASPSSRFEQRNAIDAMLGPAVGLFQDFQLMVQSVTDPDDGLTLPDEVGRRAAMRLTPYSTLFYVRGIGATIDKLFGEEEQ